MKSTWPLNKEKESQCNWNRVHSSESITGEGCIGEIGGVDRGQIMWGFCGPCKDAQIFF